MQAHSKNHDWNKLFHHPWFLWFVVIVLAAGTIGFCAVLNIDAMLHPVLLAGGALVAGLILALFKVRDLKK